MTVALSRKELIERAKSAVPAPTFNSKWFKPQPKRKLSRWANPPIVDPEELRNIRSARRGELVIARPRNASGSYMSWHLLRLYVACLTRLADEANLRDTPTGLIRQIQRLVAEAFGVSVHDLVSARRTHDLITPRHVAMYLCKELTPHSFPRIGKSFGGRDHTTALHACRKITKRLASEPELAATVDKIRARLGAPA